MSPEQANGRDVGPASDVFSLGSVLIFAATGQDPFGTGEASALLYRVVHTPAALASVPAELRPVVERCMRKDPAQRPAPGDLLAQLADDDTISNWPARQEPADDSAAGKPPQGITATPPMGYSQTEAPDPAGRHAPDPSRPLPTAQAAIHSSTASSPAAGRRRRVGWAWIAAAAVILAGAGAGIALASHPSGTGHPPRSPSVSPTATAAERAAEKVVKDYYAAINEREWGEVWQLGGKNLGKPKATMVAGFSQTSCDELRDLTATGNTVSVRVLAYETTGVLQTYAFTYTVSNGHITSAQPPLLESHHPASVPPDCPPIK
jgi:hypothetical protein